MTRKTKLLLNMALIVVVAGLAIVYLTVKSKAQVGSSVAPPISTVLLETTFDAMSPTGLVKNVAMPRGLNTIEVFIKGWDTADYSVVLDQGESSWTLLNVDVLSPSGEKMKYMLLNTTDFSDSTDITFTAYDLQNNPIGTKLLTIISR